MDLALDVEKVTDGIGTTNLHPTLRQRSDDVRASHPIRSRSFSLGTDPDAR